MQNVVEMPKIKNAGTVGWLQQCIHRGRNEVFSDVKTITPGLAEVMLNNNPSNRRVRAVKQRQMASDMKAGRWAFNGEPIIVAKTGELNDGQHRLQAILESKAPQSMLIVFGVERETRTTLDQGGARSSGDYLHMEGIPNAATLGAITRNVLAYELVAGKTMGRTQDITPAQVIERVERDITLRASAKYASIRGPKMLRYATGMVIGFCHNVLLRQDVNDGLAFMEQLCLGENLHRGDPAFTARERLLAMDDRKTPARVEVILRAWNAYRSQRKLSMIQIHGRLPELV